MWRFPKHMSEKGNLMVTGLVAAICVIPFAVGVPLGVARDKKEAKQNAENTQQQTQIVAEDAYIVVNDQHTMHYGDIIKTGSEKYDLKFNCGKSLTTSDVDEFKAYIAEPSTGAYEHKCSTCFEEEELSL